MYTEDYNRRGFPVRDFLIKLFLVILFAVILAWLLPKFMGPTVVNNNSKSGKCATSTCDTSGIKALTSQIFADNLNKMKEAAISYYTDERLPKEVGQSEKMTLSDMIGKKIIIALIDKNNKVCDLEKSYVKITKLDDEYLLKVNLKDSEKEDYILVHLGCYTYCEGKVCEKKDSNVPVKGSKSSSGGWVPIKPTPGPGPGPSPTPTPVPPKPQPDKHYCVKYNGKYYGKKGDVVTYKEYLDQCFEHKHYCTKYNGKWYGKNGTVVSYEEYKKQCTEEKHYCVKYNGKYYGKNGTVVSYEEYLDQCFEHKHYCVKYNGKWYGKYGTVVSYEEYKKQCIPEYIYEYTKTTGTKFSDWTNWGSWSKTDCATQEVNCSDSSITCLSKLQMLKRKEKIGTYQKPYARTREVVKQTGSYTEKSCNNYEYFQINTTLYATTTTTKYTTINYITTTTQHTTGSWVYNGRSSYKNPPRDTATTRYKFVGADYRDCEDTCVTLPNFTYDSYTYTGGMDSVSSTTTPGRTTTSTSTSTSSSTTTSYEASCGGYDYKVVPIYGTVTVTEKDYRTEPLYGTVCYQSTKTRKIIDKGHTYYKWSSYNDRSLLDHGWTYTGKRKVK